MEKYVLCRFCLIYTDRLYLLSYEQIMLQRKSRTTNSDTISLDSTFNLADSSVKSSTPITSCWRPEDTTNSFIDISSDSSRRRRRM